MENYTFIPRDFDRPRYFVAFLTEILSGVLYNNSLSRSLGYVGDGNSCLDAAGVCRLSVWSEDLVSLHVEIFMLFGGIGRYEAPIVSAFCVID